MALLPQPQEQYLLELENLAPRSETLKSMEQYAAERKFPIVGPLVGRMMATVAIAIQAKKVVELGSGFGYSAIWFATALGKDGAILCTEGDPENGTRAKQYFSEAGVVTPIDFQIGDALTISKQHAAPVDIVFCDIDKHEYPDAIEEAYRLLRVGGIFFTDNTLWSGKLTDPSITDKYTQGIREFNQRIFSDQRFSTTILPIRDGVAMAVKR